VEFESLNISQFFKPKSCGGYWV